MAGEIAQEVAVMLAIGSATIGAGGAIAAQVVAGVIAGKREQLRSEVEAERWKVESDGRRRDRQLDHKIELFSKFLSTTQEVAFSPTATQDTEDPARVSSRRQRALSQLRLMTAEIGILAPELYEHAESSVTSATNAALTIDAYNSAVAEGREVVIGAMDVYEAQERLLIWIELFREATRSYVSHEPIRSQKDALVAYDEKLKVELRRRLQS